MAGNENGESEIPMEKEEETISEEQGNAPATEQESSDKIVRLPLTRIKHIMKSDPDVNLSSQEAVVMLAKATELFVHMLSADAVTHTIQGKRKTLQRKDLVKAALTVKLFVKEKTASFSTFEISKIEQEIIYWTPGIAIYFWKGLLIADEHGITRVVRDTLKLNRLCDKPV